MPLVKVSDDLMVFTGSATEKMSARPRGNSFDRSRNLQSGGSKWITTSGGKHIPLGGAGGGAGGDSGAKSGAGAAPAQSDDAAKEALQQHEESKDSQKGSSQEAVAATMTVAMDSGKQQTFTFSQAASADRPKGSVVDFKYNTNKSGGMQLGTVQISITKDFGKTTQRFEKPMNEIPALVASLHSKGYAAAPQPNANAQAAERRRKGEYRTKAAGNPHHDAINGRFTYGAGNRTRDEEDAREAREQRAADAVKAGMRQPAPGQIMQQEAVAREQGQSTGADLDLHNARDLQNAASETGGSRVFNFHMGDGSDLDKSVKFFTNMNAAGRFERGQLRVEIHDPETQKRGIYIKPMSDLPKLVGQLFGKQYTQGSQHRWRTANVRKAEGRWITTAGGKHIQLGAGGGQKPAGAPIQAAAPEQKLRPSQRAAARQLSARLDSIAAGTGGASKEYAGMNTSQRESAANKMAASMGIHCSIKVSDKDQTGALGGKGLGKFNKASGTVTLFPATFERGSQVVGQTIAHEGMHAVFSKVADQYDSEQEEISDGADADNFQISQELSSVLDPFNSSLVEEEPVSNYAAAYKQRHEEELTTKSYRQYVNESVAEVARLDFMGQGKSVSAGWRDAANKIKRLGAA